MSRAERLRTTGKHRGGAIGEKFLMLPLSVYEAPQFAKLKPWSVRLLIDLVSQYNGRNNGDLSAAWKVLRPRGWNSEATLNKAKKELLGAGYIIEMRKGQRPNLCSLYALTWRPLNPSPKHDFGPNGFCMYAYRAATTPNPIDSGARAKGQRQNEVLTTPRADSGCG